MLVFKKTLLFAACCLLVLCFTGCNDITENHNNLDEQHDPIEVSDNPSVSNNALEIITETVDNEEIVQKREETTVPETENIQILSNMYNQVNRPTGQIHYNNGKTLFQMDDGMYLSNDYGKTMTKIFDDTRIYTYRDNVYILREDGIFLSDYEGQRWEKLSEYTPDMVANDLFPDTGYDAHVGVIWENKLLFRIGVPDEYGGLYIMDADGTNVKELIGRLNHVLEDDSYEDILVQYSYWCTKEGIYYSDYDTGLYRMDYNGQNRELVIEMAKVSRCIIYDNTIYYIILPGSAVYAYDIESKLTTKLFDEEALLINIAPQGLVLRTFEPQETISIYSFATKQLELITYDYYWAIFVAGSRIFGYGDWQNEEIKEYVLLDSDKI